MFEIPKPIHRSRVRQLFGREYHIARRKADWLFGSRQWATTRDSLAASHRKFSHQSLILRPLRDVDMVLQHNKRRNLELALAQLDRILIRPGETMSVWKLVGRPTRRKGYLEGLVLNQGRVSRGTGGGLCQLGNLLFWMAAHSPLTISERWRHGFDVFPDVNRTIPFGAGATLAYNHVDLQITNNTPYSFAIHLWLDHIHLRGELCCEEDYDCIYSVEERHHRIQQQIWGGYSRHNRLYRICTASDGGETEQLLVENHAIMMYEPLLKAAPY